MRNFIIIITLLFIGVLCFLTTSLTEKVVNKIGNANKKYQKHIGDKFVLNKDTLTVVNYSLINDSFTLSNGVIVGSELIINK